jgi:arylsulfatase A-like enzyme
MPLSLNNYFRIALLFSAVLVLQSCKQATNPLPNIVIIFTDDQGYGDLGSYGATQFTTPHLDQMAMEGMRFTNFYAAQAVCSASRAGLLTGCYPNRIGITGALFPTSRKGLNADEVTIAEMLKDKGYATAMFGKWHLGHEKPFLPLQHGFDEYFGMPYSNDMWPVDFAGNPVDESSERPWKVNFPVLPLIEGNEKVAEVKTLADQGQLVTQYTERALNFINKNSSKPFFLYLAHSMPHVPLGVSDKFKGKSEQGMYGDVIMEIDWSVGEVLRVLKENDLEDNTLVIFTSDNGPWLNFGNHAGSTGGLREGKGTSFEGGQREPCIMRWPGNIPPGTICNELASTIDIFSTVAAIVDAPLPEHKIDGVNILPLLLGEQGARPREGFYYYYRKNNLEAVRKGKWKLIFPHPHISYRNVLPGNDGWPGKYARDTASFALYNLRRDPGEAYDVKELYPEVVAELEEFAELAREDLGDDLQQRQGKNVRESGKLSE